MKQKIVWTLLFGLGAVGLIFYFNYSSQVESSQENGQSQLPEIAKGENGMIEEVSYQTSYEGQTYDKSAYVYLPSDYEESGENYNTLYLLHGSSMNGRDMAQDLKERLDELGTTGELAKTIVVFPTYYPDESFVVSNYTQDDPLNLNFAQTEFREDLIPAVESRYRTYANMDGQLDLVGSREHRAFGGFSMGSITAWYVLENQLDIVKYFMPLAGDSWTAGVNGGSNASQETAEILRQAVVDSGLSQADYRIFAGVGSNDGTKSSMIPMIEEMRAFPQQFTEDNLLYYENQDGGHDLDTVLAQVSHYAELLFR